MLLWWGFLCHSSQLMPDSVRRARDALGTVCDQDLDLARFPVQSYNDNTVIRKQKQEKAR